MNNKYYPMNLAEVLDQVLDLYKRSFLKQIGIYIIFYIIFTVALAIFITVGVLAAAVTAFGTFAQGSLGAGGYFVIAVIILLFLLVIAMYGALSSTGNALVTKQTFLGEHCELGKVIGMAFKKIWIATSAVIANLIALIPAIIVMGVFVFLYVTMLDGFINDGMGVISIILFSVFLILIVLTFVVLYITITMLSVSVAIFEGRWFFGALMRGFSLAQPDFFKLMGIVAIWFSITYAFSYSIEMLFGLGSALLTSFLPVEMAVLVSMGSMALSLVFTLIVGTLIAPLSGIFYTTVYINQRIKHEGLDIELNLNALRSRER